MTKFFLLIFLLLGAGAGAWAQPAAPLVPVAVRPLRSISPDDTTFAELEFLRAEIGPARVVFLGEPTHGEGNVWVAQARLMEFLQDRMGFTTLALESGFFDLHKAQQRIDSSANVRKTLANSVFPLWKDAEEFASIRTLIGSDELRVLGIDPQIGTDYGDDLTDDLEEFLAPAATTDSLDYDLLYDLIGYMSDHQNFAPSHTLDELEGQLRKADQLLATIAVSAPASRAAEARFWQQCLRSVRALARDYVAHPLETRAAADHQAHDSNARDTQMADNLLWYLREHPQEKIIVWGAQPHFANRVEMLENEELRTFHPMGRAVKAALGTRQVYVLSTLVGSGTHGAAGGPSEAVPPPPAGSLEADLLAQNTPFAFVSMRHDVPGRTLTASAFDYQPIAGEWREAVDGFLFVREVNPLHAPLASDATAAGRVVQADSAATSQPVAVPLVGSLNPLASRTGPTLRLMPEPGPYRRPAQGLVLDARTRQPVPYAAVALPSQGAGTVADAEGRFLLKLRGRALLQVSALGYVPALVPALFGEEVAQVELTPVAAVPPVLAAKNPKLAALLKRISKNRLANYELLGYAAQAYTYRRASNFDALRYEGEYLSQRWQPALRNPGLLGWLRPVPTAPQQVMAALTLTGSSIADTAAGPGFAVALADPLWTSPLFRPSQQRRFALRLDSVQQQGADTLLVISFAALPSKHRPGPNQLTNYRGRLLVQARTATVLRYEATWQADTTALNALARQHFGQKKTAASPYQTLYTDLRTTHLVQYEDGPTGHYHVRTSTGWAVNVGHRLGRKPHHTQNWCAEYFTPLASNPAPPVVGKTPPPTEAEQVRRAQHQPAFWDTFQRPLPGLAPPPPAEVE